MKNDETMMMTVEEAAADLGISRTKCYLMIREYPSFPHIKVGRRIMIPRDELRSWLMGEYTQMTTEKAEQAIPEEEECPICLKLSMNGNRLMASLWYNGERVDHGAAAIRQDITDENLRIAQAVSYATHVIFKRTQDTAAANGQPFVYRRHMGREAFSNV